MPAEQVFAANGSNEVLQTLLLAFAGPGRRVVTFEPTYQLHGHIARLTGAEVVEGERRDDFTVDLDEAGELLARAAADRDVPLLAQQPDRPGRARGDGRDEVLAEVPGLLVVDEAYGQFAPWSALDLVDEERPLVVTRTFSKTWSMAAARLGYLVGPAWLVAELEKVALPYHLDAAKQVAGRLALRFVGGDGDAGEAGGGRAGADRGPAARRCRCETWPSGANFVLFRPTGRDGRDVWQALLDRDVLIRDCSSWPRLSGCLRVTVGTPAENDAFLAALAEVARAVSRTGERSRSTKETTIEVAIDLDGDGTTSVSTGLPFYDHMLDQLGRHGGFDLTIQAEGDLHIDSHHTVEDVAIALGEAFREALGDKAGVRRFASGLYPLDEALVEVALDLSGRPYVVWEVELPECLPLGSPPFDPQLAEHAVHSFATAAGITLHVTLRRGRNVHHIIEATFKGLARSLRDAVRVEGAGVPSTKGVL